MSKAYDDPWVKTLGGPWNAAKQNSQGPCRYCGRPAAMTEPGTAWKAHKACAQRSPSAGPLGDWDGEEHKLATGGSFGCGQASPVDAISCAGTGDKPSCQLCPESPTYWKRERKWH